MKKFKLFILLLSISIFTSCKKNGPGGDSEITASVQHHGKDIPGATIYIKYGAKEFPGENISKYDEAKTFGAHQHVHFEGLLKGNYYLYAVGYDSAVAQTVKGGLAVKLNTSNERQEITIPVSED